MISDQRSPSTGPKTAQLTHRGAYTATESGSLARHHDREGLRETAGRWIDAFDEQRAQAELDSLLSLYNAPF